jgi:glutamine---fructose-6-phosphate transaminase (isomerizing)
LGGLKRLEYRGYDSAGIAVWSRTATSTCAATWANLATWQATLQASPLAGPHRHRPYPLGDARQTQPAQRPSPRQHERPRVVVVHNGIVENFLPLREELEAEGVQFNSDTDTEVIVQMIERYVEAGQGLETAVRHTLAQLKGANAVVVMSVDRPDADLRPAGQRRRHHPGLGQDEMFIASDIPAILEYTRR